MSWNKFWLILGSLLAILFVLVGIKIYNSTHDYFAQMPPLSEQLGLHTSVKSNDPQLASKTYTSGKMAIVDVNNGMSTLDRNSWKKNQIKYGKFDQLKRTSGVTTAYLEQRNVTDSSDRDQQTVVPTGWNQQVINGKEVFNRGHLIAYSLTKGFNKKGRYRFYRRKGDENNKRNLFLETAFTNQRLQTIFEAKVRQALLEDRKVIYQVQPVYRNGEVMPRGVHLQAISTDGQLNFNVYLFNVEPGVKFNYQTGTATRDATMSVPVPNDAPKFN